MPAERRWTVHDRFGNEIYITDERWDPIVEGHPEMAECEDELRETLRMGQRRQDPLNPQEYRYSHPFRALVYDNTHVVAIVLFRFEEDDRGRPMQNNYVVTAFQKEIG